MLRLPHHQRYSYSSIDTRPSYAWPDNKRLAFYIGLNIEHYAFMAGSGVDPNSGAVARQTQRNFAWRDYGLRVGLWRVFKMMDELNISATLLLNSLVCANYPEIVERIIQRGDDVCAHGRTNAESLSDLWEHDEARVIAEATQVIEEHLGKRPLGWMGPGAAETRNTPDLLAEAGYTHTLGWPVDDQPIWMNTRAGKLLSVPYPMELNDMGTNVIRYQSGREFADMVVDHFEEMLEQSIEQPLVMSVALHPFICGQPFRLRPLKKALQHCVDHPKTKELVWFTDAGKIARHCINLPAGCVPGS